MHAALAAQRRGELVEAERLYRQALTIDPEQPDALHMLGVVRLQRFDYHEARTLIQRAGERVGLGPAAFRHNYGHVLALWLSAREHAVAAAAWRAVAAARQLRVLPDAADDADVLLFRADDSADTRSTLEHLADQPRPPARVVCIGPGASHAGVADRDWPFQLQHVTPLSDAPVATVQRALSLCRSPIVSMMHGHDRPDHNWSTAVAQCAASGAGWAIARCEVRALPDELPTHVLASAFRSLATHPRTGTEVLRDPTPLAPVANVLWRLDVLRNALDTAPVDFLGVCEAALWQHEPFALATSIGVVAALPPSAAPFWDVRKGSSDSYVCRALTQEQPANPLAPCLATDGLAFLRHPLRLGLGARLTAQTLRDIAARIDAQPAPTASEYSVDGLDFVGFVRAEIGLGEAMRLLVRASDAVGLSLGLGNVRLDGSVREGDNSFAARISPQALHRTQLYCVNPDCLTDALAIDGRPLSPDVFRIGYWFWELERLPAAWIDAGKRLDEIWVATEFIARAVRAAVDLPVIRIPSPFQAPVPDRHYARTEFGLTAHAFTFMFSFDFGSFPSRKNPEAVVRAFRLAFPPARRDVQLVIKCQRSDTFPAARLALLAVCAGDDRIVLLDRTLSRGELAGLMSVIDAYVSLHRSEGLGLGLAECMAMGTPAIATAYSGNLDFMNEENSLLVDYHLVPVAAGEYVDTQHQVWAAADEAHAASHMLRLADDPAFAKALGQRAQEHIRRAHSLQSVGSAIRDRLDTIARRARSAY
jgi:glycosyltransferase involved in cell wall biosynthesis